MHGRVLRVSFVPSRLHAYYSPKHSEMVPVKELRSETFDRALIPKLAPMLQLLCFAGSSGFRLLFQDDQVLPRTIQTVERAYVHDGGCK